ncbi:MAG: hypothetical protein ACOZF0_12045 [Thermodesulfobacteriota bacterium]
MQPSFHKTGWSYINPGGGYSASLYVLGSHHEIAGIIRRVLEKDGDRI